MKEPFDLDVESGKLVKQRVVIDGVRRYVIRKDGIDRVFDPLGPVNIDEARTQAFSRYKSNISE